MVEMMKAVAAVFLFAFSLTQSLMQAGPQNADTIYFNGRVVTMWEAHPTVEAVAIRGNRFLAVGSNAELLKTVGPGTKKIDLGGRTALPGLIDSHTHPISAALSESD